MIRRPPRSTLFPYTTEYLRRLIGLGHRVAICEQVEDPKLAKGLVRRAVVETVTPGSVLGDDWLERGRNNFLLAIDTRSAPAGIAALDLTTGELLLETVASEDLAAVLARYEARELVLPGGTPAPVPLPGAVRTEREAWEFDPDLGREDLARTFQMASLDGLGVEPGDRPALGAVRSEEHTSELQSQSNLVCRLLLEKKKNAIL